MLGAVLERFRVDKSLVIACLVVAIGVTFVARGVLGGVTGDDRANLPDAVESVIPVPDAVQTLSQASVYVDLVGDYTGELEIDGVPIETVDIGDIAVANPEPGQQVALPPVTIYESGNATLTFTPSAGAPIEAFTSGRHTVRLTYWSIADGPGRARTYTWTFEVV